MILYGMLTGNDEIRVIAEFICMPRLRRHTGNTGTILMVGGAEQDPTGYLLKWLWKADYDLLFGASGAGLLDLFSPETIPFRIRRHHPEYPEFGTSRNTLITGRVCHIGFE